MTRTSNPLTSASSSPTFTLLFALPLLTRINLTDLPGHYDLPYLTAADIQTDANTNTKKGSYLCYVTPPPSMPVIYEGSPPSSFPSISNSPPERPHLARNHCHGFRFLASPLFPSPRLAGLCALLALFALLSLYSYRRRARAAAAPSSHIPLYIRAALEHQHAQQSLNQSPYLSEKRESISLAASYYDTQDDLGMEKSPADTASADSTSTTMQSQQDEKPDWAPSWQETGSTVGIGNSKGMASANSNAMEVPPPRRRSYTKMKSQGAGEEELQIQEEIVVAEGWRRHTRVYGGGVCLACAESERRNKDWGGKGVGA